MMVYRYILTLLHSERPKLGGVLAALSAIGLNEFVWLYRVFMQTDRLSAQADLNLHCLHIYKDPWLILVYKKMWCLIYFHINQL